MTDTGFALFQWAAIQRVNFQRGKLRADRVRRLEAVPGWSWTPKADSWGDSFNRLLRYIERNGSWDVRGAKDDEREVVRGWVNMQRHRYRKGTLRKDRAERLAALPGWSWGEGSN